MNKTFLFLILSLFLVACTLSSEDTFKIGMIDALTGQSADFGVQIANSMRMAVEEINTQGGVNGKILELIEEDGKCDGKEASLAAQKLIDVDKVPVIIAHCSAATLAAAPIGESEKVVIFGLIASNPQISQAGDYVFRYSPTSSDEMILIADKAYTLGYKQVGILYEFNDYPRGAMEAFTKLFEEHGGKILATESYSTDSSDFRTQILKVTSTKPDAVLVLSLTGSKAGLIIKQIRELDYDAPILSQTNVCTKDSIIAGGQAMEGAICTAPKFDPNAPKSKQYLSKYAEKFGEEPSMVAYASSAYDATYMIAEAIKTVGPEPSKIKDYLYTIKDWDGAAGKVSIDSNGDGKMPWTLKIIKNGKIEDYK